MRSILMCIARMLSAFWKSLRIFIILLLRCNLCAEIMLMFVMHSLYFSHHWFHWSLWYCAIAMLSLVEVIVKKRMHHLHFNCIFTSSWMKTFRSTIFLMMSKRKMTRLTLIKWTCISCMLIWSLAFNHWFNCIAWSCSVACSNEHVVSLCMFLSLEFQCLFFWTLLLHDIKSDSEVFLVCILCSTVHLSCHADVRLTFQMRFLISLLLSILVLLLWR